MAGRALSLIGGPTAGPRKTLMAPAIEAATPYAIRWLGAAAADRRRITRYIAQQSREPRIAISFMDTLMSKIELLGHGTVQFKPGRLAGMREYVVHPTTSWCTESMNLQNRLRSSVCGMPGRNPIEQPALRALGRD